MRQLNIGACTTRFKIEQLEAVLQQKKKKLAKLEHIRKVLTEREQVGVMNVSFSSADVQSAPCRAVPAAQLVLLHGDAQHC